MPEVFISYSRKDSPQALALAERLRADGIGVWIDQHGIHGAEHWATEIVEGIRACSTFIVLLSSDSLKSENVLKELSLASEKRKRILPVDLIPIGDPSFTLELPSSFEYSLAGLQRVPIVDYAKILESHRTGVARVQKVQDDRKTLLVLPFEDFSPGNDNAWFADGLTGELIDALGHIKSLRLTDRKTSMGFKGFKGRTMDIAKEYNVRYFIEGSVQKFGDQIKISVSLLDSEQSEYLWQDSHKGVFADIFDIQETVAQKVVEGFKLHLSKDDMKKAIDRGTSNAEAYEFFIKGQEYFNRQTREGYYHALQLHTDAIRLDPRYVNAYRSKANTLASIYRTYDRDPKLLAEGEALIEEALRIQPDRWDVYHALSHILQLQGKLEEAEKTAKLYIQNAPEDPMSHFSLGFFYFSTGQWEKAVAPYEEVIRLDPDYRVGYWNLVAACAAAQQNEKKRYYATLALPQFERHIKLHPDDESMRVSHAFFLSDAGRVEEAKVAAKKLENINDGTSLFNVSCLSAELGDVELAFKTFHRSIEAGYRNLNSLKGWLQEGGIKSYQGTPGYEEARELLEKVVAEMESGN